jgi:endonuclease/exonuclease/phosphatase (EEP) superfamily protein YafD
MVPRASGPDSGRQVHGRRQVHSGRQARYSPPPLAGFFALLFGCAVSLGACDAPGPVEPAPRAGELTLATFNVYFPAAEDEATAAALGETNADVILLQEISPRWQHVIDRRYGGAYPFQLFAPAGGAGGLGVISRFPLRDLGLLAPVLRHPAWLIGVLTPAGDVTVLNVHLRASRRRGQNIVSGLLGLSSDHELEMRSFLSACSQPPDIIAGDFNDGPHAGAVAWLERRGFIDALERHHPGEPTWRVLGGLYSSTLDHILIGAGLSAADALVLHRGNSDHWPLVSRLRSVGSSPR